MIGPQVLPEILWVGTISDGADGVPPSLTIHVCARPSERDACHACHLLAIYSRREGRKVVSLC